MTREEIHDLALDTIDKNPRVLLELPTGFGNQDLPLEHLT